MAIAGGVNPVVAGALSGKIVYTNAGHGFNDDGTNWSTDRGLTNNIVEDLGNQDQLLSFSEYLLNAGATVVPMRPVGYQPFERVLDNGSAGVTYTGSWSNSTNAIYYGTAADAVPYRFANVSATETAVATYTPSLPSAGFYPVYTWVADSSNRTNQLYRINYTGGSREIRVDHRNVGKGWVYLGTYFFDQGTAGNVQISNLSDGTGGSVVIADAIRFGNGKGDVDPGTGVSGLNREDESSYYWIQRALGQGVDPTTILVNTVTTQPRYARYMNAAPYGQSVFISFHTNAAGTRGTLGLHNTDGGVGATPNQLALANYIGKEVNDDLVAASNVAANGWEFTWFNRGTDVTLDRSDIDFGEINDAYIGGEFDATIIETAFHDNATDAALLRDPKVRDANGRATYQGAVRYFNAFGGSIATMAPGAPTDPAVTEDAANGAMRLSWTAPLANAWNGDAAASYVVEVSANGYGFQRLATVTPGAGALTYSIPLAQLDTQANFFRVRAVNAGGQSPASTVVGFAKRGAGSPRVLVVNGFDRLEKEQNVIQSVALSFNPPATGTPVNVERVRQRFSNSFDYVTQAGLALDAWTGADVGFDSVQNERVISGAVNLANYDAVVWLSGEESTRNRTFDTTEQSLLTAYVNGGGKLFASGSEIGWDLVANNNGSAFFGNTLRAGYVGDDANTYNVSGAAGSIFDGLSMVFDNGSQFYNVDFPDRLAAANGSTVAMNYVGGTGGGAGVQYQSGRTRNVTLGFPFETLTSVNSRNATMARVMNFFGLYRKGDLNNDGAVNNLDIAPFVQALSNPAGYAAGFPYADAVLVGDINGDGQLNNLDIAPFVALLTSGVAATGQATQTNAITTRKPRPVAVGGDVLGTAGGASTDAREAVGVLN